MKVKNKNRFAIQVVVALSVLLCLAGVGLTGCGGSDAKSLYESKCASCHTLDKVTGANYTGEQWTPVVDRMAAMTSTISEQDAASISSYLAENGAAK